MVNRYYNTKLYVTEKKLHLFKMKVDAINIKNHFCQIVEFVQLQS